MCGFDDKENNPENRWWNILSKKMQWTKIHMRKSRKKFNAIARKYNENNNGTKKFASQMTVPIFCWIFFFLREKKALINLEIIYVWVVTLWSYLTTINEFPNQFVFQISQFSFVPLRSVGPGTNPIYESKLSNWRPCGRNQWWHKRGFLNYLK